ncbi:diacylglycerol kinase family protein, partial [Pseudomonas bohemica]|uniref:diacylglycerol kinase family protein n=1 Tax=Pseudomonas bohemica TaxID=2044872 RepID=UPI00227917DE
MTERRAILILHGKQALNEEVRKAVQRKRKHGWELDVRLTWEAGDAQRLVTEALGAGHRQIIAGGGDGTLRDIAEALALAHSDASLIILPLGTANDFARSAGVPLDIERALDFLDVPARTIDMGSVDGQLFLNMATGG